MTLKIRTDVPASIAGYYYQLILASRELVNLLIGSSSDNDGVGIERGADIRIFSKNATNIEAKFYANKHFTKNHPSIRHTIFNFYRNYVENLDTDQLPSKYVYITNVPLSSSDRVFFENWPRGRTSHNCEYVSYIRKSVIRESIVSYPPAKKAFANYKSGLPTGMNNSWYIEQLMNTLERNQNVSEYSKYGYEIDQEEIYNFIPMIHFEFSSQKMGKVDTINSIIDDIERMLKNYKQTLTTEDCRQITLYLVQALFDTTIDNSVDYITKKKLIEIINMQESRLLEFHESQYHLDIINAIDEEINDLKEALDLDYRGQRSDDIIRTFLVLIEKLYEELESSGVSEKEFINEYSLTQHGNTVKHISSLLRSMAILSVYLDINPSNASIRRLSGIRNFQFDQCKPLCLKNGQFSLTMSMAIRQFVKQTVDRVGYIDDSDPIVLQSPFRTCQLKKDALQGIVVNIADIDMNEKYYELYSSLNYKCTQCLRIQENDAKMQDGAEQFIKGECK